MVYKPSVCIASVDSFIGQECLKECVAESWDSFASISCIYDLRKTEAFTQFLESAFASEPEAKLSVVASACDFADAGQLRECFRGCDAVVVCPPVEMEPSAMKHWCENVVDACKAASVSQILCMSCIGCETTSIGCTGNDWEVLQEAWQGADCTALSRWFECEVACRAAFPGCPVLRVGFLNQWLAAWMPFMKQTGAFQACWGVNGHGGMAPVDVCDVACCVARILCSGREDANGCWTLAPSFCDRVLNLSGSECHDATALAECFSACDGLAGTKYKACTVSECRALLTKSGCEKWQAEQCIAWLRMASCGECEWASCDVAEVCRRDACGLAAWVHANAAKLCP